MPKVEPRQPVPVTVVAADPTSRPRATALAGALGTSEGPGPSGGLELRVHDTGLGLGWHGDPRRAEVTVTLRARRGGGRQPLLRAVGTDRGVRHVVDATAGLGRDAARLAAAGARVTMIEHHPVLVVLLEDALAREAPEHVRMITGDAASILESLAPERPDVVYLDPMFPDRGKSALPRNDGQVLRALLGEGLANDPRDAELLRVARRIATRRVVVKRSPHAPPLGGARPDHVVTGSRVRFDVYLPRPD